MKHILFIVCILGTLSATPSLAIAQDTNAQNNAQKEARYNELMSKAKKLYGEKKFEESLNMFQAAYKVKQDPKVLFNMGIICERLGRLEEAVGYYDKFVVSPELSLDLRAKGQKRLDVLRPIVKAQKQKEEEANKAALAKKQQEEDKKNQNNNAIQNHKTQKTKPSSSNKLFSYVLTGAGGAAVLGGGILLLTLGDEMAFAEETTPAARRSERSSRNNRKVAGTILIGAGAAVMTTGLLVWALSGDEETKPKDESAWQITPSVGPDAAHVNVLLRF